ncbi:hypothetical protein [Methylobacterium sp. Gmos1]
MAARAPVVLGPDGLLQLLQSADTLASGLRIERYTATCNASGVATFTFTSAFKSVPLAFLIEDWNANGQMICGKVTATTLTGATAQLMISQGTFLLNAAPFTTAPSGTTGTIAVIGT